MIPDNICLAISSWNAAAGDRGGLFGAGGRFKGGVDPIMEKFNESIHFDKRYVDLFVEDNYVWIGLFSLVPQEATIILTAF